MHELEHLTDGGIQHHVCGAVCGSWWTVDICGDGTPNGYAIFSASNSEISWSYKSTGYDLVHQLRTYPVGSDPKAPSEIVVNVWDADDQWNTVWIEDGIRKGKMSRRIGKDPLAVQLLQGKDKPRKHPWAEPYNTNHLFYAPVDGATREIVVEVTDRLGGKYSEKFAATRN
jgi:hypothetical protein